MTMTRVTLTILILTTWTTFTTGQTNLVPNPSFETFTVCPTVNGNISDCSNWINFGNTPDYYNSCSTNLNVPNTGVGFQYAHTGVGMAGVVMYVDTVTSNNPQYREYIGIQLVNPLIIGQKYFLSFFVNFSKYEEQQAVECNKMGMKLFMTSYTAAQHCATNNVAHLYTDSIIKDTINWIRISGSFIADSTYKYVAIGNFFDDSHTDTIAAGAWAWAKDAAYYFIDDVCVTIDSIYNQNWTGMRNSFENNTMAFIYPNPTSDQSTLRFDNAKKEICTLTLYNHSGQIVRTINNITSDQVIIQKNDLTNGLYYFVLRTGDRVIVTGKLAVD